MRILPHVNEVKVVDTLKFSTVVDYEHIDMNLQEPTIKFDCRDLIFFTVRRMQKKSFLKNLTILQK